MAEFDSEKGVNGIGYHLTLKAISQRVKSPTPQKTQLFIGVEDLTSDGDVIRKLKDTTSLEVSTVKMH